MHHTRHPLTLIAAGACAIALSACSRSDSNAASDSGSMQAAAMPRGATAPPAGGDSAATAAPDSVAAKKPGGMSDANILAAESGGDSSEVEIAKFMRDSASSAAVKAYANLLAVEHAAGKKSADSLAHALSITPQVPPGDTSSQKTAHTLAKLRSLSGTARDQEFVNAEILDHVHDIAEAKEMEAAAKDAQVKALVQKSVPELQKHLDRARALKK